MSQNGQRHERGGLVIDKYVKSPLNYVGGKYKLLPQIIPLLPTNIERFIDLFGGGFNVGLNVDCQQVIYNDSLKQVPEMLHYFKYNNIDYLLTEIEGLIEKYSLSKTNQEGYLKLREQYNVEKSPICLYVLICYAFNNQIRFNSKGEFNMPFGRDRSSFNLTLKEKFCKFIEALHNKNVMFLSNDFRKFNNEKLNNNDCVYVDPPYLNTTAVYNENGGWTYEDERGLLEKLDNLSMRGIRFAMSNNLAVNTRLEEWANDKGYIVHYLNHNYGNCNYQKKDKRADLEVLITNYKNV